MEPARPAPRDPLDLLGVEAELEDVGRLRVPGELRVHGLVGAVGPPLDEVGDAAPAVGDEDGLVDDVHVLRERFLRLAGRALPVEVGLEADLRDARAARAVAGELGLLVRDPLVAEQVGLRVPLGRGRPLAEPERDAPLELRQMLAREIRRQVGGREDEPAGARLHVSIVAALRLQSYEAARQHPRIATATMGTDAARDAINALYADAFEIYERARAEVTIERSDGRRQRYAADRYKQQIDRGYESGMLVPAVAGIVKNRTSGFDHLEEARRPDLMLETLVLDTDKPYHHLFVENTIRTAQQKMNEYWERHPEDGRG